MTTCIIFMLLAQEPQPDGAARVQDLVKKAVEAHGGEAKLLRRFRWKERYAFGEETKGTIREASLVLPDQWWAGKRNIAESNPDRSDKTYLVWAWTLGPLLDKDSRLAPLPGVVVDGAPAAGLRLERENRRPLSLYFDAVTGRLARIDWRAFQITFSDWKEVDGARYPSKAFVRNKDGSLHLRTEFLELERTVADQ